MCTGRQRYHPLHIHTPHSLQHISQARGTISDVFSLCYLLPLLAYTSTPLAAETVAWSYFYTFYTLSVRHPYVTQDDLVWGARNKTEVATLLPPSVSCGKCHHFC